MSDYYQCDKCGAKCIYDGEWEYRDDGEPDLYNLGEMTAICKDCAQTHEIVIVKKGEKR